MSSLQTFDHDRVAESLYDVAILRANLAHPQCTLRDAGRFCEEMTEILRGVAIMQLLLNADVVAYHEHLVESAVVRRAHLAACVENDYTDFYGVRSRAEPFFDALAAGELAHAQAIAELSPETWRRGDEYEDDFCYVRFLGGLVAAAPPDPEELVALLSRFDEVLAGASSARLTMCRVLHERDAGAFDEAFSDLLAERDADVEHAAYGLASEDASASAGTYIFIEGIALLAVASSLGFETGREYRYCPALARTGTLRASRR